MSQNNNDFAVDGSRMTALYVERKVHVYAVTESELNSIAHHNTLALIFFSLGSFFLAPLADKILSILAKEDIVFSRSILIFLGIALVFYICGAAIIYFRHTVIRKIKTG